MYNIYIYIENTGKFWQISTRTPFTIV